MSNIQINDVDIDDEPVLDEDESDEDHKGIKNTIPLYVPIYPYFSYINWEALDAPEHLQFRHGSGSNDQEFCVGLEYKNKNDVLMALK